MLGFGKKKIQGDIAAKAFVDETHDWTNKTFESFQAKLRDLLQSRAGMTGLSAEPPLPGWPAVKLLYFVTLLTMATSTIRVVFSQQQYTPMINHIGNALAQWEAAHGRKAVLSAAYYDDLRDMQIAHERMMRQGGITCVAAELFLSHCGFVGKGFNYDSPINNMIFMECEMLLMDFMPKYWKQLSENYRLTT